MTIKEIPVFLTECRVCGELKQGHEMIQLNRNPTKICKLCSREVYKRRKSPDYIPPPRSKRKSYYVPKDPQKHEDLTYSDRLKDSQGFIRDLSYLPEKYELVTLKTECGKDLSGWWTGEAAGWYGRMIRPYHKIVGWKRRTAIRAN